MNKTEAENDVYKVIIGQPISPDPNLTSIEIVSVQTGRSMHLISATMEDLDLIAHTIKKFKKDNWWELDQKEKKEKK